MPSFLLLFKIYLFNWIYVSIFDSNNYIMGLIEFSIKITNSKEPSKEGEPNWEALGVSKPNDEEEYSDPIEATICLDANDVLGLIENCSDEEYPDIMDSTIVLLKSGGDFFTRTPYHTMKAKLEIAKAS